MSRIVSRLGDLIEQERQRRKAAGERDLTMLEIAEKTNLAYGTVQKWVKGQVNRYDDATLAAFCDLLDVEPGDILKRER